MTRLLADAVDLVGVLALEIFVTKDGRLLVASHVGGFSEYEPCMNLAAGACPMAFEILALDPVSLEGDVIFANRGAPMGGGTVAIDVGGELVIGSFAGDRVIRAPISVP